MAVPIGSVRRGGDTATFLDAAAAGHLLLRRCRSCGSIGGPQEARCANCGSTETEWSPASGRAQVVSWTVVHGRAAGGTTGPQAIVAIGQLEEGPWWWTQVLGAEPADMYPGRNLVVDFEPGDGEETLPVYRLG